MCVLAPHGCVEQMLFREALAAERFRCGAPLRAFAVQGAHIAGCQAEGEHHDQHHQGHSDGPAHQQAQEQTHQPCAQRGAPCAASALRAKPSSRVT